MAEMDEKTVTELEAAAFRRLVSHLRGRTDAQNIDLMNLAGFCRNCLSNWYREAASEKGLDLSKAEKILGRFHARGPALGRISAMRHDRRPGFLVCHHPSLRIVVRSGK